MLGGNGEAVDLKFKLYDLESKWGIDGYSFSADNAMQRYSGDFRRAFEGRGFNALGGSAAIARSDIGSDLHRHQRRGSRLIAASLTSVVCRSLSLHSFCAENPG
jgi:hypothetical protein